MTGGAFSPGQTYVALSRCRTLENITFDKPLSLDDIKVDERVLEFYRQIFSKDLRTLPKHKEESSEHPSNAEAIYLSKLDFEKKLLSWYETSEDEIMGSREDRTPLFIIKHEDKLFKLSPDTKRTGVKLYLDLMEKHHGDLKWSIVANANGRMNKVAFGPDKVVLSGFYLYFIDK